MIEALKVTTKDKAILRNLAMHQLELAHSDKNLAIKKEWYRHHRFEFGRPMIHIELMTFQHEVINKRLKCESELGREIEKTLYEQFINHEVFEDDRVVSDYYPIYWRTNFNLFDIKVEIIHSKNGDGINLGHQFNHQVINLEEDIPMLKKSTYSVDREGTLRYKELVDELIGDILPVKLQMNSLPVSGTQEIVHMMGMEAMFLGMYDVPDLFKDMMNKLADDWIEYFRWIEKEALLLPTTGNQHLYNGSFCFNEFLKDSSEGLMTNDVWGYMDSQETVGVSPEMFNEFIFPAYKRIANQFGSLSYGCCEAVDPIWESSLSKLDNLRKVSISPWCNEEYMGEQLKGEKIIYFRKPSPNFIGINKQLDEDNFRKHIKKTFNAAKGCQIEFAQRDVYTIHNDEEKVRKVVKIIREESYNV